MAKTYERAQLQGPIESSVQSTLTSLDVPQDNDHRRRIIRVLFRTAAKVFIAAGGGNPKEFALLSLECLREEMHHDTKAKQSDPPINGIGGDA